MGSPLVVTAKYYQYNSGFTLTIILDILPHRRIVMNSFFIACKYAQGMSMIATLHPSCPSIVVATITPSIDLVGKIQLDFLYPSKVRYLLPSSAYLPLILPTLFSVWKNSLDKVFCFCFLVLECIYPYCGSTLTPSNRPSRPFHQTGQCLSSLNTGGP